MSVRHQKCRLRDRGVFFRDTTNLTPRLDAFADRLRAAHPIGRVSRASVVVYLLREALKDPDIMRQVMGGDYELPVRTDSPAPLPHEVTQDEAFTRDEIFARDGGLCGYCGEELNPQYWDVDHRVPLSKGGPHTRENVVASCPRCNRSKGAREAPRLRPE